SGGTRPPAPPSAGPTPPHRQRRLNAGVPATQVAEWAGHSVEVLQRTYAHCLDGEDGHWFERMDAALVR
ncbi:hypothetical protein ACFQ07_00335, partial [Actinomadura adrarensis]